MVKYFVSPSLTVKPCRNLLLMVPMLFAGLLVGCDNINKPGSDSAISSIVTIEPGGWSAEQKESASNFACEANQVMVGRKHRGDENSNTSYQCAKVKQSEYLTTANQVISEKITESAGTRFICADGKVMTGRTHTGDENGITTYYCMDVMDKQQNKLKVEPNSSWSEKQNESMSSYQCPVNQVMIGRMHKGDENGVTEYLCATLR